MNAPPNENDLLQIDPARLQSALAAMPDEMVAAALQGLSVPVAERVRAALSSRRRGELEGDRASYPDRTREVARRLLLRTVFDLEPVDEAPETGAGSGKTESTQRKFLKKLAQKHPDFVRARKERVERAWMEHLRRMVRGE